jgi:hydroxymethylpyrimidine/phosphomethylpyrimidine kinase
VASEVGGSNPPNCTIFKKMTPVALTIAGSDSGGGAGIQADLKTFAAHGVYGLSAITALTAQNTCAVTATYPVSPLFVRQQLEAVITDMPPYALKTGMLATKSIIEAVGQALRDLFPSQRPPLVLDPVMVATHGARLLEEDALAALPHLFEHATLITPNIQEAALLLECAPARDEETLTTQAEKLYQRYSCAVLLKGGHLEGYVSTDILVSDQGMKRFTHPKIQTRNTHGTGCTLSAAITARLAQQCSLEGSVAQAKNYLSGALEAAAHRHLGKGHGSVEHFWEFKSLIPTAL